MNLNQLYYFEKLAKLQHYTKAAEELFISQPSLSYAINQLETELDVTLFVKKGRNVILTDEGKQFYINISKALKLIENSVRDVQSLRTINLASIVTLNADFIPQIIVDFNKLYSNVSFQITNDVTCPMLQKISEGVYDIGFCSYMNNFNDLEFIKILTQNWTFITCEDHPLTKINRAVTLEDIVQYPLITYNAISPLSNLIRNTFINAGLIPNIIYSVEDETAIGGLVCQNLGVAIVLDINLLNQFSCKKLDFDFELPERHVYLSYRKVLDYPKHIVKFIEYLKEYASR